MAIPSPWLVINLTMYSTPPTCTVTICIGKGVELVKLGYLHKFQAQLVSLAAWQVSKTHQGTHHTSHHSFIF